MSRNYISPAILSPEKRAEYQKMLRKKPAAEGPNTTEELLAGHLKIAGITGYRRQYPSRARGESWPAPIEGRDWSFDFVFGDYRDSALRRLGVWIHGQAHGQRGTGKVVGDGRTAQRPGKRSKDYEAANVLGQVLRPLGWDIFTFSPQQVATLVALRSIEAWLAGDTDAILEELQREPWKEMAAKGMKARRR